MIIKKTFLIAVLATISLPSVCFAEDFVYEQCLNCDGKLEWLNQEMPDFPMFSSYLLDDFCVTQEVEINSVCVFFSNHGNLWQNTVTQARLHLLQDPLDCDNIPGGLVIPVEVSSGACGLKVTASGLSITLAPGTYWIGLAPIVGFGAGGQEFALASDCPAYGSGVMWINPDGGLMVPPPPFDECKLVSDIVPGFEDMAFKITGCTLEPDCEPAFLSDLIETGGTICSGEKTFCEFSYSPIGDMPPATDILVIPIDGGIRFQGAFVDLPGFGASDALIEFKVKAPEGFLVSSAQLAANPLAIGEGFFVVTETFLPTDDQTVLSVYDIQPAGVTQLLDQSALSPPVQVQCVQKDIIAWAQSEDSLCVMSFIDQTFSCIDECAGNSSGFVPPLTYSVFRGLEISGMISDYELSDDVRARYNPGFVLSSAEAPVWLVFDSIAPSAIDFLVESQAGTPGLTYTVEAWNWGTLSYDVIGTQGESFNMDTVHTFPIIPADHIDPDCKVRSRVGWRKTGLTINFPWEVRIDQVGWNQ